MILASSLSLFLSIGIGLLVCLLVFALSWAGSQIPKDPAEPPSPSADVWPPPPNRPPSI